LLEDRSLTCPSVRECPPKPGLAFPRQYQLVQLRLRCAAKLELRDPKQPAPLRLIREAEAADEYDAYLGQIASRLREGATVDDLAAFLNDVEEVQMGLGDSPLARESNQALAARLRSWYGESIAAEAQ
jgi:hypothetical protein